MANQLQFKEWVEDTQLLMEYWSTISAAQAPALYFCTTESITAVKMSETSSPGSANK